MKIFPFHISAQWFRHVRYLVFLCTFTLEVYKVSGHGAQHEKTNTLASGLYNYPSPLKPASHENIQNIKLNNIPKVSRMHQ